MKFKTGELIVRCDSRHPEGTLVVDHYDEDGNLLAYPLGGGFEMAIPTDEVVRFSVVTKQEATPIYRKAWFNLECLDDVQLFGWTDNKRWNGWAMPLFEITQATKLTEFLMDQLRYDSAQDVFIGLSGDDEEIWAGQFIDLPDGGQVKVYAIGAGSWTWDLCK